MPGFAGKVFHNNANRPVVDVADNQVKGLGIFSSVSDRNALDPTIQTDGFLALTNDGGSYKAFVFTGSTWNNDSDWTEVGGDALPSGSNYSVLVRGGDNAITFNTTPRISAVEVFNSSGASAPNIVFTRTSDDNGAAQATSNGDSLGQITFRGHNNVDSVTEAGLIRFTQVGAAGTSLSSKMELSVGTSTGSQVAVTVNEERVMSIARLSSAPSAVAGGLYADTSDNVYFGIS